MNQFDFFKKLRTRYYRRNFHIFKNIESFDYLWIKSDDLNRDHFIYFAPHIIKDKII